MDPALRRRDDEGRYEAITFVHSGASFAPEDVVRDVATFVDYLDVEPVRLLGWSQGAAIAQEVALLRPDLVAAAALVASYGRQNTFDRILQCAWRVLDGSGTDYDPVRLALLALTSYPPQLLGDDSFVDPRVDAMREWSRPPADPTLVDAPSSSSIAIKSGSPRWPPSRFPASAWGSN